MVSLKVYAVLFITICTYCMICYSGQRSTSFTIPSYNRQNTLKTTALQLLHVWVFHQFHKKMHLTHMHLWHCIYLCTISYSVTNTFFVGRLPMHFTLRCYSELNVATSHSALRCYSKLNIPFECTSWICCTIQNLNFIRAPEVIWDIRKTASCFAIAVRNQDLLMNTSSDDFSQMSDGGGGGALADWFNIYAS